MSSTRPDVIEAADSAANTATAYTLSVGQTGQGTVSSLGDHDWYRISLTAGQTYSFAEIGTGTNSLSDPFLNLRNSGGAVVGSDDNNGPGQSSSLTYTAPTSGIYYIDAGARNDTSAGQYGIAATLGTRPNFDIPMGAGAIDAYAAWSAPGAGVTVTYGFRQSAAGYSVNGHNISTFSQVSAAEMAAVQSILRLWSDVANITFSLVNPGGYTNSATILIANYSDASDGAGAFAFYPGSTGSGSAAGDLWLNLSGGVSAGAVPVGSYSFFAIMHEFGHALGLSHPGDYNAAPGVSITYSQHAQFAQDTEQYSVMSYFGGANTGESPGGFASGYTPMMFDIYELQNLYGANYSTRASDTVYGFGSTAGSIYSFSSSAPAYCIWDGGGNDTLNCSGYSQTELINLNEGTFSNVGGGTANISIALGVTIESAIGGSGNDTIIGNGADNILQGGPGNDNIDGLDGIDTAVFSGSRLAYTVTHAGAGYQVLGPEGTDYLVNIERLSFADTSDNPSNLAVPQTHWLASVDIGPHAAAWLPAGTGDFNHDGTSDLAWYNATTGDTEAWLLSNGHWEGGINIGPHNTAWRLAGIGDFNHDGNSDVLWYNPTTGNAEIWKIANNQWAGSVNLGSHDTAWQPAGVGDFNGDGTSDILWYNPTTGATEYWKTANGQWAGSVNLGSHNTAWRPAGLGDFNHDGFGDLLWYNATTGDTEAWKIANDQWAGGINFGPHNTAWQPAAAADFNLDGTSDILWYNPASGNAEIWKTQNGQWAGSVDVGTHPGHPQFAGAGDVNHDGMTDILWRDPISTHLEAWLLTQG